MQPVLRVRRKRPRFSRLPTRSLVGLALTCLEGVALGAALIYGGVELWVREGEASFAPGEPRVLAGITVGEEPIAGLDAQALRAELSARSSSWLDAPMRLESELESLDTTPRKLGATHDPRHAVQEALAWGRNPNAWERIKERLHARTKGVEIPMRARVDRNSTRRVLEELAPSLRRESTAGRVELKARRFLPPTPARGLLIDETVPRVALAMAQGDPKVSLATYAVIPPERAASVQAFPKISTVVGQARVALDPKCPGGAGRQANVARALAALNGWVLAPQARLGVWNLLGEPSIKQGFREAQACPPNAQPARLDNGLSSLASAIWTASFFAGMDLLQSALPEDRIYGVELGLDAQLRWPSDDLEVGNPHAFPVVLHIQANEKEILVQWLGQSRPFKISFEREIRARKAFETVEQGDAKALLGSRTTLRAGRPGYTVQRRRIWKMPGAQDRVEITSLKYPPRSALISVGQDPLGPPPSPEKEPETKNDTEDPVIRITR